MFPVGLWHAIIVPQLFLNNEVRLGYLYKKKANNPFLDGKNFIVRMKVIKEPVRIMTPFLLSNVNDNDTGP